MSNIILLGAGPSAAECPHDKEVWGVNATIKWQYQPISKLFFFDDLEIFNPAVMTVEDLKYNRHETEYISTYKNAEYGKTVGLEITEYPLHDIIKEFKTTYFSNSVAYMIAYAMYKGVTSMDLYGIDHLTGFSYLNERAGVEYWMGRAVQSGIKIHIAIGSALLRTCTGRMYGYDKFFDGQEPLYNELIVT
jgi:hypothetical protein